MTPMTQPDTQAQLLAKVDEYAQRNIGVHHEQDGSVREEVLDEELMSFLLALRKAIERCAPNGYTTWDKGMVPMVDGKFDPIEAEKWEKAHGHDIRLKCYPEYGCQLLIDPEDLLTEIAKELGL